MKNIFRDKSLTINDTSILVGLELGKSIDEIAGNLEISSINVSKVIKKLLTHFKCHDSNALVAMM